MKPRTQAATIAAVIVVSGSMFLWFLSRSRVTDAPESMWNPDAGPPEQAAASLDLPQTAPPPRTDSTVASEEPTAPERPPAELMKGRYLLTGRLVEEVSGAGSSLSPVEGAKVDFKPHPRRADPKRAPPPQHMVTGPDGTFAFGAIPWGMWLRLEVDAPDRAVRTLSFHLGDPEGEGRIDLGDVPLEPGLDLVIEVSGPEDEAVTGAKVMVKRTVDPRLAAAGMYESHREAKDEGDGIYRLERMAPGTLRVQVLAAGYSRFREHVAVPDDGLITVRLKGGQVIRGSVTTLEGEPLAGAELQIVGPGLIFPFPTTRSDARGRFVFDLLSAAEYRIRARAEGYVELTKRQLRPGGEPVILALEPASLFSGRVLSRDQGTPVAKAHVTLMKPGHRAEAESDADGVFSVSGLVGGSYFMTVDHEAYAPLYEGSVEVKPEEKIEGIELRLEQGLTTPGRITDGATGAGVAGAWVTLIPLDAPTGARSVKRMAKTLEDGSFSVAGLHEGPHSMRIKAPRYVGDRTRTVNVDANGSEGLDVVLHAGSSITGRVTDSSGQPVVGASVFLSVSPNGGGLSRAATTAATVPTVGYSPRSTSSPRIRKISAQTDAKGVYLLRGVPPWDGYMVTATHPDHAFALLDGIAIDSNENLEGVDLVLERGGSIEGWVTDEAGRALAGAEVRYQIVHARDDGRQVLLAVLADRSRPGNDSDERFITPADGSFSIPGLPSGTYTLTARLSGRRPATVEGVDVREGRAAGPLRIVLRRGEILAGQVVDGTGSPIAGAIVLSVRSESGHRSESLRQVTDADGQFAFDGLGAGPTPLTVSRPGFVSYSTTVTLPSSKNVRISLEAAGRVSGLVLASADVNYSSVRIYAASTGETSRPATLFRPDTSGEFSFELGAGTYRLVAVAPGLAPGKSAGFTVEAGDDLIGVDIPLSQGGELFAIVVSARSGEAIEGARILIEPDGVGWGPGWAPPAKSSDRSGEALFRNLPEGSYRLVADHPHHARAHLNVTVVEGENSPLQIVLPPGATVKGRVLREGKPIEGLMILAAVKDVPLAAAPSGDLSRAPRSARTDSEGSFQLRGVEPGRGTLLVITVAESRRPRAEQPPGPRMISGRPVMMERAAFERLPASKYVLRIDGRTYRPDDEVRFENGKTLNVEVELKE